ncbi:MAG: hypothetical protein ACRDUV_14720 [Pseudonocardiaceae bacterium]
MTLKKDDWNRQRLSGIGLAIDHYQPWPSYLVKLDDGANLYQMIGDTGGQVFLRYGSGETVDAFLATLADAVTDVSIGADEIVHYHNWPARQVTVSQQRPQIGVYRTKDPRFGPSHDTIPASTTHVEIIGFRHNSIPVLVGFRIPQEALDEHRPVLRRIISSVSQTDEYPNQSRLSQ